MSLLSYTELCELVEQGVIVGVKDGAINGTSIDVHLGSEIICETYGDHRAYAVDIAKRTSWAHHTIKLPDGGFHYLTPGEFVLASTVETFNLPADISAEFKLKSSGARSGLDNALATWCDPHWHGSVLTLELKNNLRYHSIILTAGMPIGQMIFHRSAPVPHEKGYAVRGKYNKDTSVQGVKQCATE